MVSLNVTQSVVKVNNVIYLGNFNQFCYLVNALDWCSALIKLKQIFEQCILYLYVPEHYLNVHCWKVCSKWNNNIM